MSQLKSTHIHTFREYAVEDKHAQYNLIRSGDPPRWGRGGESVWGSKVKYDMCGRVAHGKERVRMKGGAEDEWGGKAHCWACDWFRRAHLDGLAAPLPKDLTPQPHAQRHHDT